jgi:hypothetical protein
MRLGMAAILGLTAALWCGVASAQGVHAEAFDGAWAVTLDCPASPDGAAAFSYVFKAEVSGDLMHGEHGQEGQPGWMTLDGAIAADGAANLQATGLTGSPQYNIQDTAKGVPYRHPVTAHFTAQHGTGSWTTNRVCTFTFERP